MRINYWYKKMNYIENGLPTQNTGLEDFDGLEGCEESQLENYSEELMDSVYCRTETRTVKQVVERIEKERYILDPDFQRDLVWDKKQQSKLIESCIRKIPIPVFYVSESASGKVTVVDGLQRLSTFRDFLTGNLKLSGLSNSIEGTHPLDGKIFSDLSVQRQERLEDTQLTLYILEHKTPEEVMMEIFERVNSGTTLTRQQMRNALFNGPATRWLSSVVNGEPFKIATKESISSKLMRDREAVNRFVSFYLLGWRNYSNGDMNTFLARGLKQLNEASDHVRVELRNKFDNSMILNYEIFGEQAFRRSMVDEGNQKFTINISLFEVLSVFFADFDRDSILSKKEKVKETVRKLVGEEEFKGQITRSTNSTKSVRFRYEKLFNIANQLMDAQ